MMTGIACVIHDDLRSHRRISTARVSLPARSNCNRIAGRRMFKNAAQVLLELRDRAYLKLGEIVLDTMRREPPAVRQQQALHIFRASLR